MGTTKRATEATEAAPTAPTAPKKAKKPRAKASKKSSPAAIRADALLGKRFTHRKRSEWGIGTVVDGGDSAIVLAWADGEARRTARTYLDQLVEVP